MDNQFQPKENQQSNNVNQPGDTVQPGMKTKGADDVASPPEPFTMDDPAQLATPAPSSSQQGQPTEPKPFTMDDQVPVSRSSSSPTQNPPEPTGNLGNMDGMNASSAAAPLTPQSSPAPGASIQPGQSATDVPHQPISPTPQDNPSPLNQDQAVQSATPPATTQEQPNATSPTPTAAQATSAPVPPAPSQPDQSLAQPAPIPSGTSPSNGGQKPGWKKRAPLIVAALVLASAAAGVFGYYIPNRPENVYRAGLDRTGQMISQLDEQFAAIEEIASSDGFQADGSVNTLMEEGAFTGTMTLRASESSSETKIDVSGEMGDDSFGMNASLGLDIITDIAEGNDYPDVFFQVRGGELLSMISPQLAQFDERWVHAEASYIEETLSDFIDNIESEDNDAEGWLELIEDVGDVVADYVLTSDDKGILELDEIVGAEDRNNKNTYRYDVSINHDKTEQFCTELFDTIAQSSFMRTQLGSPSSDITDEERKDQIEYCVESLVDFDDEVDITMWIDRRTKLIHQLRFEDEDGFTFELGQTYDGSDEFDVFINAFDDQVDMRLAVTINNAASSVAMNLDIELEEMADDDEFTIRMSVEPFDGSVEIERPNNATDLEDFMGQLMSAFYSPQPVDPVVQAGFGAEFDAQFDDDFSFDEPPMRAQPTFVETLQELLPAAARFE